MTHPHHQRLTDSINSFAGSHDILRVFLSYSQTSQKHLLIVHISNSKVPDDVPQSKWIRKALEQYDTHIIILGSIDVNRHLRLGSLLINRYCNASSFVYKVEDHELTYPDLSKQLKRFKQFKEDYYHKHDLLSNEIQGAKNNGSLTMAYQLYISLFQHHLFHLEFLYLGGYFHNDTLSKRVMRLEVYYISISLTSSCCKLS